MSGDIEIPEDEGEALGALLGSRHDEPRRMPVPPAGYTPPTAAPGPPPTDEEVFMEAESAWDQLPGAEEFGPLGAPPERTRTATVDDALLEQAGRRRQAAPAGAAGDFGDEFGGGSTRIVGVDEELLRRAAGDRAPAPPPAGVDDFYDDVVFEQTPVEPIDALPSMLTEDLGDRGRQGDKTPVPGALVDLRSRAADRTPVPGAPPAGPPAVAADIFGAPAAAPRTPPAADESPRVAWPADDDDEAEITIEAGEPTLEIAVEPSPVEPPPAAATPIAPDDSARVARPVLEAPAAAAAPLAGRGDEIIFDEPDLPPPDAVAIPIATGEILFDEPDLPPPAAEPAPAEPALEAAAPLSPPVEPPVAAVEAAATESQPAAEPVAAPVAAAPAAAAEAAALGFAAAEAAAAESTDAMFGAVDELLRQPPAADSLGEGEAELVAQAALEIVEPSIEAEADLDVEPPTAEEAAGAGAPLFPSLTETPPLPGLEAELPGVAAAPAVELRPEAFQVPEQAEPVPEDRDYWERQAELLQAEYHLAGEDARAASLAYAAGRVFEVRLNDLARARELYEQANNRDPQHGPTLRALRRIAARQGAWDDVFTTLELETGRATPEERAALLAYRGELLLARGDAAGARALFTQQLDAQPDDLQARLALCDVAVMGDEHEEALRAVAATADSVEPGLRAELRLELARRLEHLGRDEEAAASYRIAAEQEQPLCGALLGLWRIALRGGDAATAADLEARLAGPLKAAAGPLTRHQAVLRLTRLGDPTGAHAAAAAADAEGSSPLSLVTLAEALVAAGDLAGAAAALVRLATATGDPGRRAATLLRLAELREAKLADAEGAAAALTLALEAVPDLVPAQLALERVSVAGAVPERLLAVARGAALTDAERAPFSLLQAARLLARALGRPEEAITELGRALATAPGYIPAVREQVRLLTEAGRHAAAAEALDRAAAALDEERPADAAALREAAAAVAGRGPDGAADELRRLEALCAQTDVAPPLRWARLCARLGQDATADLAGLCDILAADAEAAVESARAAALWHRRGLLLAQDGRADAAAEAERQALTLAAQHPGAYAALFIRAVAAGAHGEAADLGRARATAVAARGSAPAAEGTDAPARGAEAAALLLAAGAVLEQEARDPVAASPVYDELSALTPGYRPARDAQLRVAAAASDHGRRAALLTAELEAITDPAHRLALLLALSDALAQAGDASRAVEPARRALDLTPADPLALGALTNLYLTSRNFAAIAEFAFAELKTAEATGAKVAAYERLAEIDADQRGDVHSAVLGYETILELDPSHAPTLRTLERYYLTQERWAELAATYERLARAVQQTAPQLAVEVHLTRARLLETKVAGEPEAPPPPTLEIFEAAAAADPQCLRALRRVEIARRAAKAAEGRLDAALRLAAAVGDDAGAAAIYLTRAAELSADLERVDDALRLYAEAAAKAPGYLPARRGLRRLTLARELWPQVVAAAEGEGEALRGTAQRASAFLLAGAVAQERLADPTRAIAAFRRVLEVEPDSNEAFTRLRGLLGAREAWPELCALLKQRAETEKDPAKLVDLHFGLGEVLRDHLGDRAQAKAQLKAALHHAPQHGRALAALAALHYEDGDWAEAADAFFRRLRVERDREILKDILFKLGLIYAEKLPDTKRAVAAFARVLQLDPENRQALAHLAELHLKDRNWKEAYTASARLAALEQEPEHKVMQMLRLARILDEGFKDQRRATEMYRKAIEVDPFSLAAIGEFAKFYERQNDTRSVHVHLDTSITRFRSLLGQDPFNVNAYGALFQLFTWRGDPDRAHTAAQILNALGGTDERVQAYLHQTGGKMEVAGGALAEPLVDDLLFPGSVPAGFRHLFRLLDASLDKAYRADLKGYQVARGDRLPRTAHPVREIANGIAEALRLGDFDIYVSNAQPNALALENTDPPAIILGANLVKQASHEELRFALGRTLKLLQLHMALPSRLTPKELGLLASGIVRQFVPDFVPPGYEEAAIIAESSKVGRAIPRKMHQELMPFALECAGTIDWDALVIDIVHVGNRAGLLLCGSVAAALTTLRRAAGHTDLAATPESFARACRGNRQIEELLRFAVSNEYLELRRQLGIALA
ncbi:MAG TPA: hypothetical protein VGQ83_41975 [Polyangia bacterium]